MPILFRNAICYKCFFSFFCLAEFITSDGSFIYFFFLLNDKLTHTRYVYYYCPQVDNFFFFATHTSISQSSSRVGPSYEFLFILQLVFQDFFGEVNQFIERSEEE